MVRKYKNLTVDFGDRKPPIGAKPAYVALPERIQELSGAISRYANSGFANDRRMVRQIKNWAREIVYLCEALEKLQETGGKDE